MELNKEQKDYEGDGNDTRRDDNVAKLTNVSVGKIMVQNVSRADTM